MKKNILSMSIIAVLTAVTSSSVMGFDSIAPSSELTTPDNCVADLVDGDGVDDIIVYEGTLHSLTGSHRLGAYRTPLKPAETPLELEPEGRGDALIYPLYKAANGWETEIVVRNTDSKHAIVAKASLRRKNDSLEVFDFNLYLSADDVTRFTIKENKTTGGIIIYSEDGSILRDIPSAGSNGNDVTKEDFASKDKPFYVDETMLARRINDNGALTKLTNANTGYVVIFGMGEAKGKNDDKGEDRYHDDHARLFADYRKELDVCRTPWRVGLTKSMLNGTFIRNTIIYTKADGTNIYSNSENFSIPAPNQEERCVSGSDDTVAGNYFGDVNQDYKNGLTGTVRMYTATDKDGNITRDATRDMVLPAVAVKNFTDNNKIIYTEGEIAALQDRWIVPTNSTVATSADHKWAEYQETKICTDAMAFHVSRTTYTFDAKSVANQLLVTQPYKRILVQMGNDKRYWQDVILNAYKPPVYDADGKLTSFGHFGGFSYIYNVYDEHEKMSKIDYTYSPYSASFARVIRPELASMADMEKGTEFEGENGFARLWFTNEAGQRAPIPAIITQMIGSTIDIGAVGSPTLVPELNWIYSQFRKENN